jgi:hypothetical protein
MVNPRASGFTYYFIFGRGIASVDFSSFYFLNRTVHVMVLYRITTIMGHAFFICVVPNHGSHFLHAIGPQDWQTSKKTVTLNQHPPVHHEGWMVSG